MSAPLTYAKKRDRVEPDIVSTLERIGCLVMRVNEVPFDLLVQCRGILWALEIKTGKGVLKPSQKEAIAAGWRIHVVRTAGEAAMLVTGSPNPTPARLRTHGGHTK